jgi:hypothetical protein
MKQVLTRSFIAVLAGTYFLSVGVAFGFFRFVLPSGTSDLTSPVGEDQEQVGQDFGDLLLDIAPGAPRTEACPLSGELFTTVEREAWEKRRPLLVMVENHQESRPQSALSMADVVYESVAEGAITRFMAAFYCEAISHDIIIGPVRSARTYFLDWASEYSQNPLYAHVGGANEPGPTDALGQIQRYGWGLENDLNQFSLTVKECWRDYSRLDHPVATEHTMYCSSEALWKVAERRGWAALGEDGKHWEDTFTPWKFADPKPETPQATTIAFDFWSDYKDYAVRWEYDSASNTYRRFNGGNAHTDRNTGNQLEFRVVVVQFTRERGPVNDLKHLLYDTIGSGKALIFQNGQAIDATWAKKSRLSRTVYFDSSGREIEFARGKIWIHNLPAGQKVDYR